MKKAMRFSVLASGSGGNSCYIETDQSRLLIDAGLSCRELIRRLELIGVDPHTIDALVITHEHLDHIRGAGPIARRFDIPLYINRPTLIEGLKTLGNISNPITVETGAVIPIRDIRIKTFTKCHDAADPMGLTISSNGRSLGLVTDLGRSTRLLEDHLKGCNSLVIEFNHDREMLDHGPYPLSLQRRIRGSEGHLSNNQAGELLKNISHERLKKVVLAHLSQKNNIPEKAEREAVKALAGRGLKGIEIFISKQDEPLPMMEI